MDLFTGVSILIVLSAAFAYINHRFIKLPSAIGLMAMALVCSLLVVASGKVYSPFAEKLSGILRSIDFSELLLGSMLSFMLFAGAIHIKLEHLRPQRLSVIVLSTFSVIISTFIIGTAVYYLLMLFQLQSNFIYCLLFGSLISPTDPIAVMSILKQAGVSKFLETKIAGESLFNDGVAVVVFLTILSVAEQPGQFEWSNVIILFIREAIGGLIWGVVIGYLGIRLIKSIDNYIVEVFITLAMVMGGYSAAHAMGISGPLAMVAAGIIVGNPGKENAMSDVAAEYVDKFWELVDEFLNAILFVMIGLQLLIVNFDPIYIFAGIICIVIVLLARYISVFLPVQLIQSKEKVTRKTVLLLTWGGLRGGISIALALSLQPQMQKDLWVTLTYFVVAFSILVQGLTIGNLAKFLKNRAL